MICEEGDSSIEVLEDLEMDRWASKDLYQGYGAKGSWFPGQKKRGTNAKGEGGLPSK